MNQLPGCLKQWFIFLWYHHGVICFLLFLNRILFFTFSILPGEAYYTTSSTNHHMAESILIKPSFVIQLGKHLPKADIQYSYNHRYNIWFFMDMNMVHTSTKSTFSFKTLALIPLSPFHSRKGPQQLISSEHILNPTSLSIEQAITGWIKLSFSAVSGPLMMVMKKNDLPLSSVIMWISFCLV